MKRILLLLTIILMTTGLCQAQPAGDGKVYEVKPFDRLMASPRIDVILEKGTTPSVRIVCQKIDPSDVNVDVVNGRLKIYLDGARMTEKNVFIQQGDDERAVPMYSGGKVTAYVTYTELHEVEIRGAQSLTCDQPLATDRLKIKAYGEARIFLAAVEAAKLEVAMYGDNQLRIGGGQAKEQRFMLAGENKVETLKMEGEHISSTIYGEGKLQVNATSEISLTAIGGPTVEWLGGAHLHRGIIVGEPTITGLHP